MDKVLIWGIGSYYDKYIANWVNKKEVEVLAFVTSDSVVCSILDGKPIIKPQDIRDYQYDYIIIASKFYKEIRWKIINELSISANKLINGRVIKLPCFSWKRYIKILESRITLIAEVCYGGYIYNQLGLQFNSPFINTRIEENDYLKLLEKLYYYLEQKIVLINDIGTVENMKSTMVSPDVSWGKMGYPVFALDDVKLHAIHTLNPYTYTEEWNRRIKRINTNNVLVMMILENDNVAKRFSRLNIKNKIGFYFKEMESTDIVCLKEWADFKIRLRSGHDFLSYVHHLFYDENFLRYIDIFKMLNGEKDFLRMY